MFPLRDTQNSAKFPFINLAIILLNIYVFFQELISPDTETFVAKYALIPANIDFIRNETLVPFVTAMFLHAGFLHILSNMWFLWIFGDNVESKIGHLKYLFFYLFCGLAAGVAQYIFTINSTVPAIGASGAIAGVLGAYLRFFSRNRVDTLIPVFGLPIILALPANIILIYWFFTQAFNGVASIVTVTAAVGGIAYVAHAGGFIAGLASSRLFAWPNFRK